MITLLVVAIWLFVITHVDTLVVLVAFCTDDAYPLRDVLFGHYVGFSLGLAGAIVLTILTAGVLREWAFVLGLVPIGIGIWSLFRRRPDVPVGLDDISGPLNRIGIVTGTGIGLSGENIAIFVPFFLTLSTAELVLVVAVYLVGAGGVFFVALVVARWAVSVGLPPWLEHRLVPAMLVGVGTYVLATGWISQ